MAAGLKYSVLDSHHLLSSPLLLQTICPPSTQLSATSAKNQIFPLFTSTTKPCIALTRKRQINIEYQFDSVQQFIKKSRVQIQICKKLINGVRREVNGNNLLRGTQQYSLKSTIFLSDQQAINAFQAHRDQIMASMVGTVNFKKVIPTSFFKLRKSPVQVNIRESKQANQEKDRRPGGDEKQVKQLTRSRGKSTYQPIFQRARPRQRVNTQC